MSGTGCKVISNAVSSEVMASLRASCWARAIWFGYGTGISFLSG